MKKSIEVKAKTAHEAIEDACTQLGVSQDQITFEILSQGGMFGKMRVLVTVKEEAALVTKVPADVSMTPKPSAPEPASRRGRSGLGERGLGNAEDLSEDEAAKQRGRVPQATKPNEKTSRAEPAGDGKPSDPNAPKFTKTLAFVTELLTLLENNATVTTEMTDRSFNINVNGDNIGRLIGKGGEVLNAIQALVSSIAISNANGEGKRVFVNIGDYKERRGDTLQSLAMKKADYVKKSGRQVKLDPMNSRDRAIIHSALAAVEGIKTYSTGKDPFRCLCIAPEDKSKPTDN